MARLEEIRIGSRIQGLAPEGVATVKAVQFFGDQALEVIFSDDLGHLGQRIVYRDDEHRLTIVEGGRAWSFDGDGALLRLVSEAHRIKLAWLFDPYLAITTSSIEPLPHQIAAVYQEMLPRQPMRFLLADDPGAGKTIMAGLLIKELMLRADLERCLIVSPGSLVEQWQDELAEKFGLEQFEILTRDMIAASRTSNPFEHKGLLIARLDQLSRNEDVQERFKAAPEWDLIICDEAHRMAAHLQGDEVTYTKRYRLGELLGTHTRNLLLMTATPHNGNEGDFQLFLALLDGDRFAGHYREGVHSADPSDLMRRMIKEDLRRFNGKKLFPERWSYTAQYALSPLEAQLYAEVTEYVREEMNRADRLGDEEKQRRTNVGFALMTLQRRLASSPEAILRSIERRRERLASRLREEKLLLRGNASAPIATPSGLPKLDEDDWDDLYEEAPQEEREAAEEKVVDHATAARTVAELQTEIASLQGIETLARKVHATAEDTKWVELTNILDDPLMVDDNGHRRKLVVFTEFKDTLIYLARRIRARLGRAEAVVEIHGGVAREDRRKIVAAFMNDPTVLVLVANDAAGEGVNLQRAHLMINYDLPWNPNRLEQRFGRIHRIGQREVCHLWNLVAHETREGDVFARLLVKLEAEREALGGKVFDVLGKTFEKRSLRELLVEAIRYGNDPAVQARLDQAVDMAMDHANLATLIERQVLVQGKMDLSCIQAIREDMDRAHARRLQPHFILSFFLEAFERLGGKIERREEGRFEVTHVPAVIRERDRRIGLGAPVQKRYERICFDKRFVEEQPRALLVCPGNPLLDATIDLVLEQFSDLLKRGAILVDDDDIGSSPRLLFFLEHAVADGRRLPSGAYQTVSQRLLFIEATQAGDFRDAGPAPCLDYRPLREDERALVANLLEADWLKENWEQKVLAYAIKSVVPGHVKEVQNQRLPLIDKVEREVRARLMKEVNYWDHRAQDMKARERAGKPTRLPAQQAEERAQRASDRLQQRTAALADERNIMPEPPNVKGGALIIPAGLLRQLRGEPAPTLSANAEARKRVELLAMQAVMSSERALGREPRDVSSQTGLGYDIESRSPEGRLLFIEVKGRVDGADSVTLTRNEILCAKNAADKFLLAVVVVEGEVAKAPVYVKGFDFGDPGFAQTSATYDIASLLRSGQAGS